MTDDATIADLLGQALIAYDGLVTLGEDVEDEWGYVQDLSGAWRSALERASVASGTRSAPQPAAAAVARLMDEVGRITDPHRAIDWLSTFPQAVLLAVGVDPWAPT
ncbi:MAG: hypothetical protein U0667_08710 [Chloroflexota bacterium]